MPYVVFTYYFVYVKSTECLSYCAEIETCLTKLKTLKISATAARLTSYKSIGFL